MGQLTHTKQVEIIDLGLVDYERAWNIQQEYQQRLVSLKREGKPPANHYLIFCQHPAVYTLGKSGDSQHLLMNETGLEARGAKFFKINRGGDITFHGPGQWVVYPILDLDHFFTDVHRYVRGLEEIVIRTLQEYGIVAHRLKDFTGVWLEPSELLKSRKICAIGVHLSRWVTLHGLALNVNTDLQYFDYIVPCGIADPDKQVTSMKKELGHEIEMSGVKELMIKHFSEVFECEIK